jgi:pimeloyl-ACP methyl ester carboxylesterase
MDNVHVATQGHRSRRYIRLYGHADHQHGFFLDISQSNINTIMQKHFSWILSSWAMTASLIDHGNAAALNNSTCISSTFSFPEIKGAELIDVAANEVHNFSTISVLPGTDIPATKPIDFCNVTVAYTHPGWNDTINVSLWIPLADWNGRLLGVGGGGFSASFGSLYQTAAVDKGFVAVATDSGHLPGQEAATDPSSWAILSPGNLNLPLIADWTSRTLGELSTIAKHATKDYFGAGPSYSYFTGCSAGGRQGLELAQTFPDAFDGILAAAPAIYFETFLVSGYWPTLLMNHLNVFPSQCEIKAFTKSAVEQCDKLDGLEDGIISYPAYCAFNASALVGSNFTCDGEQGTYTEAGAAIVEAAWAGFNASGVSWPGVEIGADLTDSLVITDCPESNAACLTKGLWTGMLANFVVADPDFDPSTLSTDDFANLLAQSIAMYRSSLGSVNPDLHRFHQASGKLITWHGLADTTIPTKGSEKYYNEVVKHNDNVPDFYRYFEAPGVGHCSGNKGPLPNKGLEQLMAWVENGTAPDTLEASSASTGLNRPLCSFPSRQVYVGGNANETTSFACVPNA